MAKLISLEKKKRLYKAEFDNKKIIYVTEDTIVRFFLSKGGEYDDATIAEIEEFADFSRGKGLAYYYLNFKARTKMEVIKYLKDHDIPGKQIARIIDELEASGFVNDQTYTDSYIRGKILGGGNGPYVIKQKLKEKGVDLNLIDDRLESLYGEEVQIAVASKVAEKLVRAKFSRIPYNQLKQKVLENLTSKGFNFGVSKIAWESLDLDRDSENEQELLAVEFGKQYRRLSRKYEGYDLKQRLTQALARKGFTFDDIGDYLREQDL
jgi:regulatory protein